MTNRRPSPSMSDAELDDEKLHELYRLQNGLNAIHLATVRWNALSAEFSKKVRQLPEFYFGGCQQDIDAHRRAHELAVGSRKNAEMLAAVEPEKLAA